MKFDIEDKNESSGAKKSISHLKNFISRPGFAIIMVLCIFLLIGICVVTDYGESWDEQARYEYAKHSLVAYEGKYRVLEDEKGPFFVMVALLGARIITSITPAWRQVDALHFMIFLSYLMGLFFFYRLCRRLVNSRSALGATLLFATQPLLWGHAFINPKDIPFMSFFLGSMTLGLEMVDSFDRRYSQATHKKLTPRPHHFWKNFSRGWREAAKFHKILLILSGCFLIFLIFGKNAILEGIASMIHQAYSNPSSGGLAGLFSLLAQNAGQIPVDAYIHKGQVFFNRLALPLMVGLLLVIAFEINKIFNNTIRWIFYGRITPQTILAGIFLGLSSAVRALGPASGLLVGLYFLLKSRIKAITTLFLYFGLAALVTYLAWPGLWGSPLNNFIASFRQTGDFAYANKVLFNGQEYFPKDLPSSYLPTLMGLQFTETALVCIIAGVVLAVLMVIKHADKRLDILILSIWFLAPLGQAIIFHTTIYDNFRQLLFVIPPLFVFSSLSFQRLSDFLKNKAIYLLITFVLILPGVYWIIQLHPYQYIYYNSLIGGTKGAFRRFEMDYWATSYKEATEYLNQVAADNAFILVRGPAQIVNTYARPDLIIEEYPRQGSPETLPDYIVVTSRYNEDLSLFPEIEPVYQITRDEAILSVVKQIPSQTPETP
jgi:hypothetical protein